MAKGQKTGGGSRKGIPNKRTAETKAHLANIVDDVAIERGGYESLVGALWDLARGTVVVGTKDDSRIYKKPPDALAAKIILEFRFGKAAQNVNLSSDGPEINIKGITDLLGIKPSELSDFVGLLKKSLGRE